MNKHFTKIALGILALTCVAFIYSIYSVDKDDRQGSDVLLGATITDLETTTTGSDSRTIINTNFDNLNTAITNLEATTSMSLLTSASNLSITESQISDLGTYLTAVPEGYISTSSQLGQIGDVSTTTLAYGHLLMYDGSNWQDTATSSLNITANTDGLLTQVLATSTYLTISASTSIEYLPNLTITESQISDLGAYITQAYATSSFAAIGGAFHDGFSDFVANEHIDWTSDQGATDIHAGNYTDTNTTYTAGGTLLDLTDTTFSLNEGTLTNSKYCTYVTGTGIVCNSDGGASATTTWQFATSTATAAQTTFDLPFTYTVASDQLEVYVNGLRMTLYDDYTEASTTAITFVSGRTEGDKVSFQISGGASEGTSDTTCDGGSCSIANTGTLDGYEGATLLNWDFSTSSLDYWFDNTTGVTRLVPYITQAYASSTFYTKTEIDAFGYISQAYASSTFQLLDSTLTDIADGTINENLVNTANPWADDEVADNITASNYLALTASTSVYTAGRSLALTGSTLDADAELYTDTKCVYIEDPTADDDLKSLWRAPVDLTITEIWAESDQTVTFDLQEDDGSPADISGIDLAPAAGETSTTTFATGDAAIAAGSEIDLVVTSVASTPTWVSICIKFTKND